MMGSTDTYDERTHELLGEIKDEIRDLASALVARRDQADDRQPTSDLDAIRITIPERIVLNCLGQAWSNFVQLGQFHPDDIGEFREAIHRAQNLIAFRVARRCDPDVWNPITTRGT